MYILENGKKVLSDRAQLDRKLQIINKTRSMYNGERYVQITEETDRLYMMDLYGGLSDEYFPNTADSLCKTGGLAEENGIYAVTGDVCRDGFMDAVFLKGISEENDNVRLNGGAVVVDFVRQMTLEIDIYEKAGSGNDETLYVMFQGEPCFSYAADRMVSADILVSKSQLAGKECGVLLTAAWVTEEGILKMKTKTVDLGDILSDEHMIASVNVNDPAWKREKPKNIEEPVIICYDRTPELEDEYDYMLDFSEGGFYIPTKGNAVFADKGLTFDYVATTMSLGSSSCLMFIRRDGGGAAYFENEPDKDFAQFFSLYKEEGTGMPGFQWDFKKVRWMARNPLPAMEIIHADYKMTVDYYVKNSKKKHTMMIYSDNGLSGDKAKVGSLQIYWGCLYHDTAVTMEDGSRKMIQEIQAGQRVKTPYGSLVVREQVKGEELKGIYRLTTCSDNKSKKKILYLTIEHPLVTDKGIMVLEKLTPYIDELGQVAYEEQIASEDGGYERICAVELAVVTDNTVYNLVLEQEDKSLPKPENAVFYAEGLLVGDNNLQAKAVQMQMEQLRQEHGLPKSWEQDVHSAEKFFQINQKEKIVWQK